jgi:pimeloyl-ACP methyl ester carboxylesterase
LEGLVLAAPIATGPEAYAAWIAFAGSDNNAEPAVLDPDFLRDFDEVAAVTKSKTPLLVIHGLVDRLIPVQQAREVMAASSSEHKQLLEIPDASHFGLPNRPEAIQAFRAFVQFTMSKRTLLPSSTVGL